MFKVLTEGCEPKRATRYSAAVDLFAAEDVVIKAGETAKIRLGICICDGQLKRISDKDLENLAGIPINEIENGDGDSDEVYFDVFKSSHYLQISPRSSLGLKGLIIPNGIGIIDLDYKGEICLILHNPITGITKHPISNKEDLNAFTCLNSSNAYSYKINKGEKIAQIMLCEHKSYLLGYKSEEERVGGFGSTGE